MNNPLVSKYNINQNLCRAEYTTPVKIHKTPNTKLLRKQDVQLYKTRHPQPYSISLSGT